MPRRPPPERRALAAGLALAALAGCSGDAPPPTTALDAGASDLGRADAAAADAGSDRPRADAAAPGDRRRLPVGATYYLPPGGAWSVAAAPAGNLNAVFRDEGSGRGAFVPHLVGDYRFASTSGGAVTLTVVDPSSLAFHNLDYFPTGAVVAAAGVAFVAGVLRPEVVAVDPADLSPAYAVPVGAWPVAVAPVAARGTLLVACRGEDSLTVVDLATRRPVRSVWVGDEVSNVAVTPDGATAIALLPHDRQVVLINTADWSERARVAVGSDPHYLAVRADGGGVFVAGRRTGPGAAVEAGDPAGADLAEIDLATGAVVRTVHRVGTTLGGIALAPGGRELYVTTLRNDPAADLASEFAGHFQHTVARYDVGPGAAIREAAAVDVTRSRRVAPPPGSDAGAPADAHADAADDAGAAPDPLDARRAVGLHWIGVRDGAVWVVAESSDLVLRLDAATLAERGRFDAPGRPRAGAIAADGTVLVFGHQAQRLTAIDAAAGARTSAPLATDPRPAAVASGAAVFTGTGIRADLGDGRVVAGDVWSCGACHVDGLTDGLAWAVGPAGSYRALTPALTLLDGTAPLGWQGAAGDVAAAPFTLHGRVGLQRPAQSQVDALAAYLGSIAPPPAPNSLTDRDGAPSPEATRGAASFAAHCASCHPGPLATSRARVNPDLGGGPLADVASLVGAARHGAWLRDGSQRTLAGAVGAWVDHLRAPLDAAQRAELTRYVAELTGREFFVVAERPRRSEPLPATASVALLFSQPVLDRPENLARVELLDPAGRPLAVRLAVEGRRLLVTPAAPLPFSTALRVVVGAGLESEREARTQRPQEFAFDTVAPPGLRLSGAYTLTYSAPDPRGGAPSPAAVALTLSSDGGGLVSVVATYAGAPLQWRAAGSISGRRLRLPPMPLPLGGAFADAISGFDAELGDGDGDGVADAAPDGGDGGVAGFTLAGTGFEYPNLPWRLARAAGGQ